MTRRCPALAALLLLPALCLADDTCPGDVGARSDPSTLIVRSDNDLYGREGQDQGYSNGFVLVHVSPEVSDFRTDPCLAPLARWINRPLAWLQPRDAERQNMVVGFSHLIYTPTDGTRSDLIPDDRPYAGVALVGVGYNGRRGDRLTSTHLRLGMVGPSAFGQDGQAGVHKFFGRTRFQGWDNQLRDEVLVQLLHERLWRRDLFRHGNGWEWDLIGHAGGSLGNFATYANAGGEIRFGKNLPDDFGTDPLRPAGENTAPGERSTGEAEWDWHFFLGVDARWVLQDITLDGNTSKDSHSVERREALADVVVGVAITHGDWKIAGSHVRRTREFEGQDEAPVFGTVSISRTF